MRIFFTYQGEVEKYFLNLDVSESSTVAEILKLPSVKSILDSITHSITIGVNGEILDGVFKTIHECENGRDINALLNGPVCHTGFKRLN